MSIFALVSGSLFRDPKSQISKAGKPYVTATIKVSDGTESSFVRVTAFSDGVRAELVGLKDGAAISVTGRLKAELYDPGNGAARVSMSIIADQVMVLRKTSKPKHDSPTKAAAAPSRGRDFDDDLPAWGA
ncbi:single-stranded DNA-binding protein [Rhodoblastus sp.]|uniref:single-stranded DNA-binding protein n=1 Tax=Rhodoblastus sp. TaxID=1962975 RepID=UPI003F94631E